METEQKPKESCHGVRQNVERVVVFINKVISKLLWSFLMSRVYRTLDVDTLYTCTIHATQVSLLNQHGLYC